MKERKVGLDLLRIFTMMGIVSLHILGHGGVLKSSEGNTIMYGAFWSIEILLFCSVNVFAILTGYLSNGREKINYYRLIELLLTILFYGIIITVFMIFYKPSSFNNIKDYLYSIFPLENYWYIFNFIPLFILTPFINKVLNNLTLNQEKKLFIIILILFSFLNIINGDWWGINKGYSFLWLLVCFIIGDYLRKKEIKFKRITYILLVLICEILLVGINVVIKLTNLSDHSFLIQYTSPIIVLMGICIFRFFETINFNCKINKFITLFSLVTLDVYIIHEHFLVREHIILNNFKWITNYNFIISLLIFIGVIIILYLLLSIVSLIRYYLFKLFNFKNLFMKLSKSNLNFSIENTNINIEEKINSVDVNAIQDNKN